ncbi:MULTISPECIES: hypothetical protein [Dyella]|uniref:Uncharacterized protein n=2 Tax=Dyella TaxID=231454 RepID=A0A4R0Z1U2_9GAMM|nr:MULTISPECIES: hypothetical protein [Dyella]TBR39266.1 hypothetical protein EYV96_03305 [Dyella terrae]TCI13146.1 hypothetical protein EZM97_07560 [Dyella soli]
MTQRHLNTSEALARADSSATCVMLDRQNVVRCASISVAMLLKYPIFSGVCDGCSFGFAARFAVKMGNAMTYRIECPFSSTMYLTFHFTEIDDWHESVLSLRNARCCERMPKDGDDLQVIFDAAVAPFEKYPLQGVMTYTFDSVPEVHPWPKEAAA